MKVACPGCQTQYDIDESKIPATGMSVSCPKCGSVFEIDASMASGSAPPPGPSPDPSPPPADSEPEFDRSLLVPLRYSAGMMLGDTPWGLFGPDTGKAFGHLGFTNNFLWADPERATSVALLTTGKLVVGLHAPYLLNLLYRISKHCPKLSEEAQREQLAATGMA